jgi:hypothetical protein
MTRASLVWKQQYWCRSVVQAKGSFSDNILREWHAHAVLHVELNFLAGAEEQGQELGGKADERGSARQEAAAPTLKEAGPTPCLRSN